MDMSDVAVAAASGDALTHAEIQATDDSAFPLRPEISERATEIREFAAAEASESVPVDMARMEQPAYSTPTESAPVMSARAQHAPAESEVIDVAPSTQAHVAMAPARVELERVAPTPVNVPTAAVEESPRPTPVAAAEIPPRPEPAPVPAPKTPQPSLDDALRESGLVLIETSPTKAQAVTAPVEDNPVAPPAPRARRAPPTDIEQPLQQVETRK